MPRVKTSTAKKAAPKKAAARKAEPRKAAAKKPAAPAAKKKIAPATSVITEPFSKSQIMAHISEETGLAKKQVGEFFESIHNLVQRHMKKRACGEFNFPGLMKLTVKDKPATKARKGTNPFTGEEMMFKAKPARRVVKVRPLKKLKEMAE